MNGSGLETANREYLRWLILTTLNAARPVGTSEAIILNAIQTVPLQMTMLELRKELAYLADRSLVTITGKDSPCWHAELNHHGIDVVEYAVECLPGIARPKKWW